MDYKDYYKILGVSKSASEREIRDAFRRLARQHHPDVNPGSPDAAARFKEINEAYEVLSDAEKRQKYDELGANWRQYEQWQRAGGAPPTGFGGAPHRGYEYRTVSEEDLQDLFGESAPFSDFFHAHFGGTRRRAEARQHRGEDLEYLVEITLEEAAAGATRLLQLQQPDGSVKRAEVKIPAGVRTGSRVRIAGQGGPGFQGGPAGDLYLVVEVAAHPVFHVRDDDLHVKVTAPLTTAVLGGEIPVPTLKGQVMLKIPELTQDGRVFRLRGQGLARPDGVRGDLYAEVHVELPKQLDDRQRTLFSQLAEA